MRCIFHDYSGGTKILLYNKNNKFRNKFETELY